MRNIVALPLVVAMTALLSVATVEAQTKVMSKNPTAEANLWGDMPTPHHPQTGMRITAAHGESVFMDHCALCHGLSGKGDGPRSAFFVHGQQYIADLSNAALVNGRDDQLLKSIRGGLHRFPEPNYIMPQFKYILSDEDILSVLAYIKTLPARGKK